MIVNCPACGAQLPIQFKYAKLIVCSHCRMTLFLEDAAVRQAEKMSVLTDANSVLSLGQRFHCPRFNFFPIGRIRYDYGQGFWDEWWVTANNGEQYWISVDEGDIAIQKKIVLVSSSIQDFSSLQIGQIMNIDNTELEVTEKNSCKSVNWEGELPFQITKDEVINFVDLSGTAELIYSLEYFPDGVECFKGEWINPLELKAG